MTFENYLSEAWRKHAGEAEKVAADFDHGVNLINHPEQISQMAGLVTHVMGEHLGYWDKGVEILKNLRQHPAFQSESEADKAIERSIASLNLAGGKSEALFHFLPSDQVRILCLASSALQTRSIFRAKELFHHALEVADMLEIEDPANRSLAVTGNNLACALEELPQRGQEENELMIIAAQTGRKYWERAGTWLEVERAEYRLAMSHLKLSEPASALIHAQRCLEICTANGAAALEFFFAYECTALCAKACGDQKLFSSAADEARSYFSRLSPNDQSWCKASLEKLN